MLTLTEKLFLLSLHEKKKWIELSNHHTLRYGLAGALLADLIHWEKIRIDDEKLVNMIQDTPIGNELLDKTIASIQESKQPHKISYWLDHLSCGKKQQMKLIASLESHGILRREEKRFLWMIPYIVFPDTNASAKYTVKEKLRSAVLANHPLEVHDQVLLSLLNACKMLDHVFTKDEIKSSRHRVNDLVKDEILGRAVFDVIQEVESGSIAAMLIISG